MSGTPPARPKEPCSSFAYKSVVHAVIDTYCLHEEREDAPSCQAAAMPMGKASGSKPLQPGDPYLPGLRAVQTCLATGQQTHRPNSINTANLHVMI